MLHFQHLQYYLCVLPEHKWFLSAFANIILYNFCYYYSPRATINYLRILHKEKCYICPVFHKQQHLHVPFHFLSTFLYVGLRIEENSYLRYMQRLGCLPESYSW